MRHLVTDLVSAAIVIGALVVGLRVLVRQAFSHRAPKLQGTRVRTQTGVRWWLLRWSLTLAWRMMTLAIRFAVGAPRAGDSFQQHPPRLLFRQSEDIPVHLSLIHI